MQVRSYPCRRHRSVSMLAFGSLMFITGAHDRAGSRAADASGGARSTIAGGSRRRFDNVASTSPTVTSPCVSPPGDDAVGRVDRLARLDVVSRGEIGHYRAGVLEGDLAGSFHLLSYRGVTVGRVQIAGRGTFTVREDRGRGLVLAPFEDPHHTDCLTTHVETPGDDGFDTASSMRAPQGAEDGHADRPDDRLHPRRAQRGGRRRPSRGAGPARRRARQRGADQQPHRHATACSAHAGGRVYGGVPARHAARPHPGERTRRRIHRQRARPARHPPLRMWSHCSWGRPRPAAFRR